MINGLNRLPSFEITSLSENGAHGRFVAETGIEAGNLGYLFSDSGISVFGRFVEVDPQTGQAVFRPKDSTITLLKSSYRYADGYWGERVALILDKSRLWTRKEFKTHGNWDHEHCSICWEEVSEHAQPFGYSDQNDHWVCEKCYSSCVESKVLGFIDELAVSQIVGKANA